MTIMRNPMNFSKRDTLASVTKFLHLGTNIFLVFFYDVIPVQFGGSVVMFCSPIYYRDLISVPRSPKENDYTPISRGISPVTSYSFYFVGVFVPRYCYFYSYSVWKGFHIEATCLTPFSGLRGPEVFRN